MPDLIQRIARPRRLTPALHDDGTLVAELDIAFSTHMTLVVPGRVEFACGSAPQDIDLVIARAQCRQQRPLLRALVDAAQSALACSARGHRLALAGRPRVLRRPRALLARVAGQWQALWCWPAGLADPALPAPR